MAARTTLTRSPGQGIASAHMNALRDHVVPFGSTDDVTSEGQMAVNTTTKRLVVHDGTAAVRVGYYSPAGRTGGSWTLPSTSASVGSVQVLDSTTVSLYWTGEEFDSDNLMTIGAVNPSIAYVPVAGIYVVTLYVQYTTTWTTAGNVVRLNVGGLVFDSTLDPTLGRQTLTVMRPMAASDSIQAQVLQASGSSRNLATVTRLDIYRVSP